MAAGEGPTILTVGHSNRTLDEFVTLIRAHRVELVADVRRFPGSRRYPHFNRESLSQALPGHGSAYLHLPELGGRRKAAPESLNSAWRNEMFRGYADYMETVEFRTAMDALTAEAKSRRTAVMCAEALWWQCHRSMMADYLKAAGWQVLHILGTEKTEEHRYTEPARRKAHLSPAGAATTCSGFQLAPRKMKSTHAESRLTIGGKTLALSNLDKVFYPKTGFSKGQVIDYYIRISQWLLPHLKDRPLTLKRYPNGVEGQFFYEKRCPSFRPNWLKIAPIWSEGNQDNINFCLANDLPSLVWAANLGDLELHTFLSKKRAPLRPTMMVFDLDPGPPADILNCVRVSFWLREVFERLGVQSFPKTTGSKGLQVYVPLNTPVTFDQTKSFARTLAELLTREHPNEVVYDMKKALRNGKVLVDWSQNDDHKTTVCVYSLRAKERPTASTPVTWQELEKVHRSGNKEALEFDSEMVIKRAEKLGDLFAPVLSLKQKLPKL